MAIILTEEEKRLVADGTLDPMKIEERRKIHPVHSVDVNEVDAIKQEIRETNVFYRDSIQKNKDLYDELKENRKKKEELRNKLAELRLKKKQILGLVQ
jgi:hypothetical protein